MGVSAIATIAGAAITAGGAIAASNNASDATQAASDAQTSANDKALALQQQEFNTTQAEYAPWRTVGAGALQMLARTEGIQVPADTFSYYNLPASNSNTASGGTSTGGFGGAQQIDWDAYLKANPDVMAWAQSGHGDPNTPIDQQTLEQRAAYHYYGSGPDDPNSGQSQGRAITYLPSTTGATGSTITPGAQVDTGAKDINGNPIMSTTGKPTGLSAAPTSNVPAGASSQYGDFFASPDYQFRLNQGETAITGNMAAKGLLDSGALGKGLIDYGQQAASQEFGNWYNRIAALAGVGQTAVAGSTAAGQANANAQTGIIQNTGATQASSLATQGGINSGLISNLAGTTSGLISNLGRSNASGTPIPLQTIQDPGLVPANSNIGVSGLTSGMPDASLFGSPI